MSEPRPVVPLTLLGAVAPVCEGDDCLPPANAAAPASGIGSSPGRPTAG
jgi:hypothetical protein